MNANLTLIGQSITFFVFVWFCWKFILPPLIHAMRKGSETQRELISKAILDGGRERMSDILEIIQATGALDYTARRAREAADAAIQMLADLPDTPYRCALMSLAEFAVQRRS